MYELQRAIQDVRAFLAPPEGFASGDKIYGPESDDPLAPLKRKMIALGLVCIEACEQDPRPDVDTFAGFRRRMDEYRSRLAPQDRDLEAPTYERFLGAIECLISVAEKCRSGE